MATTIDDIVRILNAQSRPLTSEYVRECIAPLLEDSRAALDSAARSMHSLGSAEGYWRFTLPGGIIAKVQFGSDPERRHIEAFKKVFMAAVDAWLESDTA